jgi:hypothetical protein
MVANVGDARVLSDETAFFFALLHLFSVRKPKTASAFSIY